jgi:NADH-quinone oxidoreductase subunit J
MAAERVAGLAEGRPLTPLPAPGVYAQNNAMDTPALGPDGRPLEHSVPRVLRIRGQQRTAAEVLGAEETLRARLGLPAVATAEADAAAELLESLESEPADDAAAPTAPADDEEARD